MRLTVRVTPRSSRDVVEGFDATGVLRVRVTAPPADNAANEAVSRLLARTLNLPGRDVTLISGAASRLKVFDLPLTQPELEAALAVSRTE
jgi:uncharacterized protein YggU (UPF0235/DUF167 family)